MEWHDFWFLSEYIINRLLNKIMYACSVQYDPVQTRSQPSLSINWHLGMSCGISMTSDLVYAAY